MVHQRAYSVTTLAGTFLAILAWDDNIHPSVGALLSELYGSTSTIVEVNDRDLREWPAEQGYPIVLVTGLI